MTADAAGDRRQHMGEFDVELGGLQCTLGLRLSRMSRLQRLTALVDDLLRDRASLNQGQAPVEFTLRKLFLGPRVVELTLGLQRDRLKRAWIDDVKQIACMNDRTIRERDPVDEAADASADLNLLDRLEPAGELIPVGDCSFHRLRNCHRRWRWRWRGRLRLRLVSAANERQRKQQNDRRAAAPKAAKRTTRG